MKCTETRRSTLFWILLAIFLVCLTAGIVVITIHIRTARPLAGSTPEPQPESQAETPRQKTNYYYAGMPLHTNLLVLTNIGYVVGYDDQRKNPAWVCYRLFATNHHALPKPGFKTDKRTKAKVKPSDYPGSGYDRGHMAPNAAIADCYDTTAQRETFLMSNIVPQKSNLNQRVWKQLESDETNYAQQFTQVWVIAGPIFEAQTNKLPSGVQVPEKCFKMIVKEADGQPQVLAFIMPQDVAGTEQPAQFLTNVAAIENLTGLNFFSELTNSIQLEAETAKRMW